MSDSMLYTFVHLVSMLNTLSRRSMVVDQFMDYCFGTSPRLLIDGAGPVPASVFGPDGPIIH